MLHLPATFQRSGLIPTLLTLVFVCILAALCSLHMANTISKVPGNHDFKKEVRWMKDASYWKWICCVALFLFTKNSLVNDMPWQQKVEYAETFRSFWGHRSFVFAQVLFFVCISCLNISSIVDTAQTVDTALGNYRGTKGLQISWDPEDDLFTVVHWRASECSDDMRVAGTCLPFFDDDAPSTVILTMGYMICVAIFLIWYR